jgi:hypothetical protein
MNVLRWYVYPILQSPLANPDDLHCMDDGIRLLASLLKCYLVVTFVLYFSPFIIAFGLPMRKVPLPCSQQWAGYSVMYRNA